MMPITMTYFPVRTAASGELLTDSGWRDKSASLLLQILGLMLSFQPNKLCADENIHINQDSHEFNNRPLISRVKMISFKNCCSTTAFELAVC